MQDDRSLCLPLYWIPLSICIDNGISYRQASNISVPGDARASKVLRIFCMFSKIRNSFIISQEHICYLTIFIHLNLILTLAPAI